MRKVQSIKNGPLGPAAGGQAGLPARTIMKRYASGFIHTLPVQRIA